MKRSEFSRKARQVFGDYLLRVQGGEKVDFEDLCRSNPEVRSELARLHTDWNPSGARLKAPEVAQDFASRLRDVYGTAADQGATLDLRAGGPRHESGLERLKDLAEKHAKGRRYLFLGEIARGGMGIILHVWDSTLRRDLAMKVMHASGDSKSATQPLLSRFLEEAQVTGQLGHPGVVPLHDLGIDQNGQVYFTMPLIEGMDLEAIFDLIKKHEEGWTLARGLEVIVKVCDVMVYAHFRGVLHRDLKPANVMVGKFGEAYVMDWGLAKVSGREDRAEVRQRLTPEERDSQALAASDDGSSALKTLAGTIIGTPSYMPPEQAHGRLDQIGPRSDVYSIGAMLYHLLAGQMPYVNPGSRITPHTILKMVKNAPPPSLNVLVPAAPMELVAICEKAMQRDMDARYRDVGELAADLRAFLEGGVVKAYERGFFAESRKLLLRNKAIAASLFVALGALLTVVYVNVREAGDLERANLELVEARDRAQAREVEATWRSQAADLAAAETRRWMDEMLEEAWRTALSRGSSGASLHKSLARVRKLDGSGAAGGSWHGVLGALLYRTGDHEGARRTLMEAQEIRVGESSELSRFATLAFCAMALARLNRPAEADQLLTRLRSTDGSRPSEEDPMSALLRETVEVLGEGATDPARRK